MLLNNFRPLVQFYNAFTFKNVNGDTVNKYDVVAGLNDTNNRNNHSQKGSASTFDYTTTTDTNSFTKEGENAQWRSIVGTATSGNSPGSAPNGFILFVGTGNTAVQMTDYKLANAVELSVIAASCTHNAQEKTIVTRTFYNNTSDPVTIKEVGLYLFQHQCNNAKYMYLIMIGRKVLDTPVTIEVGESYTFTYTIDMSQVNFAEADNS